MATTTAPPFAQVPTAAQAESLRYRPIRLSGHFPGAQQILLDNMTSAGRVGYQVLTPFRADSGELVLVNRGWLPAAPDRRELPAIALGGVGKRTIGGRIDALPRAALSLGEPTVVAAAGQPVVLSYPDFATLDTVLGESVARFQLLLDPAEPDGFERHWGPPTDRDERSFGYAVQWFALALLSLVLAIGIAIRGRRRVSQAAA